MTENFINSVTTPNGTYTVGMTANQAKQNKAYKCAFNIDFRDLDTNGNGELSQREILEGVKKQAKRTMLEGAFNAVNGSLLIGVGIFESIATVGLGAEIGVFAVGAGGTQAVIGVKNLSGAKSLYDQADEQIEKLNYDC